MNERVFKIREAFNMSQESFGKKLGVTRAAISRIESGKSNLTDSNIKLICGEFKVSEEWLRTGDGNMLTFTDPDNKFAYLSGKLTLDEDPFKKALLTAMMEMSDDEWDVVKRIILKAVGSK